MHDLFFEINQQHGTTIVVVTHNPAFAERMPRVVTLKDGRVETDERRGGGPDGAGASGGEPSRRERSSRFRSVADSSARDGRVRCRTRTATTHDDRPA